MRARALIETLSDELCWIALSAAGLKTDDREAIWAAGGPRHALSNQRRIPPLVAYARLSVPFLETGGRVVGGAQPMGRAEHRKAPLVMFGRGQLSLDDPRPAVAVIGAREPTAAGAHRARRIAEELVARGAIVVSGAARGIDRAAHEAAIAAGGASIAVLGDPVRASGEDERPRFLRALFDGAPERSLSLSPYGPWTEPHRAMFAARNTWIAALADAVIVVEGEEGSGTRHTIEAGRRFSIPLFGVPGCVDEPLAWTPNDLLRGQGTAYLPGGRGSADVLGAPPAGASVVQLELAPVGATAARPTGRGPRPASPVLELLEAEGALDADALSERLAQPVGLLLADLLDLELAGWVTRSGAGYRVV